MYFIVCSLRKCHILLFLLQTSLFLGGCGRIGFELLISDSETATPTDTESNIDSDPETDSIVDSDTQTSSSSDSETHPDSDSGPDSDSTTQTESESEFDSASDSSSDSDTDSTSDSDSTPDTDSDTGLPPCPAIPAGTVLLSETDAVDFTYFGTITATFDAVSAPSFASAWHVTPTAQINSSTFAQLQHGIPGAISEGDHLVVEFWTRCVSAVSGTCHTGMLVEEAVEPWARIAEYYPSVTSEWDFHQAPFVAKTNFASGTAQLTFRMGYNDQVLEIFPSRVINYGPLEGAPRIDCLDHTTTELTSVNFAGAAPPVALVDFEFTYWIEVNGAPEPTVSAIGLPSWLQLDPQGKRLHGTPSYADLGTTPVFTLLADNTFDSDTRDMQITVAVDPALLGHWKLDETSGATALDSSGKNQHATVVGDPVWQPTGGNIGGTLTLEGASGSLDYAEIPSNAALNIVQDGGYTIMAWVRPLSIPSGTAESQNSYGYGVLLKSGPPTGLFYNSNQEFVGPHRFASVVKAPTAGPYPPGTFYHVAVVRDLEYNAQVLYVNGESVDAQYYLPDEPLRDYGITPWRIGIGDPTGATYRYEANLDIDDVRIYSRALADYEIRNLAGVP